MRVFLNHSGRRTSNPDVVVLVRSARVKAGIKKLRIARGIDHIACWIELDDRRSELTPVQIAFDNILPVQNEDVVLRVDANPAQTSKHPAVWQRLSDARWESWSMFSAERADGLRQHSSGKQAVGLFEYSRE